MSVLPKWFLEAHGSPEDMCPCQWGPCGHCLAGRPEKCAHHHYPPRSQRSPDPETYLTGRRGGALALVRRADGSGCSWVCPGPPPAEPEIAADLFEFAGWDIALWAENKIGPSGRLAISGSGRS